MFYIHSSSFLEAPIDTTLSPVEAARSCLTTGDCRKTERIPTDVLAGAKNEISNTKKNKRILSELTKQQLRTQVRLCLFANIC